MKALKIPEHEIINPLHFLYNTLSYRVSVRDQTIVIKKEFYKPNQRAGLVALLRLQDTDSNHVKVKWREEQDDKPGSGESENNGGVTGGQDEGAT